LNDIPKAAVFDPEWRKRQLRPGLETFQPLPEGRCTDHIWGIYFADYATAAYTPEQREALLCKS